MSKRSFNIIRNEKGIVLLIALMVLVMLSLMGLAAILTSTTDVQIAGNETHSTQALYLAEAGVGEVKSWFESPVSFNPPAGSYTLDSNNSMTNGGVTYTFPKDFFKKRRKDATNAPNYYQTVAGLNLSQFTDINNSGGLDASDANNINDDGKTTDQNGVRNDGDHPVLSIKAPPETGGTAAADTYLNDPTTGLFKDLSGMGRVTVLEIYPPMLNTNYATVRVKAVDAAGATRTIEQEIGPSNNFTVTAGLNAHGASGWNGNGSVNWGPVVTNGNVSTGQNSIHCKTSPCNQGGTPDKWWSLDATGTVTVNPVISLPDPNYAITPNSTKTPQTLSLDTKAALKQYSLDTGQYYVYCSTDGLLHKGNSSGLPTGAGTSFQTLTQGKSYDMLYVDIGKIDPSCNPTTPAMPTFNVGGGGGYYTQSNIILNGTFSISGSGGTTNITAQDPDQVDAGQAGTHSLGVHINGFLYTTGNFDSGGNPVVYGAVIAEGGFTGSGTPDIWYNKNLANGLPALPLTSTQGWREVRK